MSSNRLIKRRGFLGTTGLVAASALGVGAAGLAASPARADLRGEPTPVHEDNPRFETFEFSSSSISARLLPAPRVSILLPEGYHTSGKRYPVLYLLHGGGGNHLEFRHADIERLTRGKEIIVVMPDGGRVGWYSNPATTSIVIGRRHWETFHMNELLPWVEAHYRTHAEYAGRAVCGFSMGGFGALKYTAKYYGHFASVSCHSGPASLRRDGGRVAHYINATGMLEFGRTTYGVPWREDLVSADNPVERIESYRNKRIFLVSGSDRSTFFNGEINVGIKDITAPPREVWNQLQEQHVLDGQREFGHLLDQAGIPHTRYEEPGGHALRPHRFEEDINGIVAHLKRAS